MNEIDIDDIRYKSVTGIVALTSRTFFLQIISLVSTFILTILLDPATFGIFFVVTAIVNFLNYFSDVGLAAALIQKKDAPTREDLATTFTIQQILVVSAVIIAWLATPLIGRVYTVGVGGIFLFRALVIAFFLSSLKTIPSVLLERKLDFQKLVIPQIVETVLFYITAITLAYFGFGVISFAWAALARGVSGTVLLYLIAPWRPALTLNKQSSKTLLSFGLPYQANSFLALVKDDLLTAFLGVWLPFSAVGYIGWAKKWAEITLRLIMDNVIKVTFPAYARLQHDAKLLSRAIEKSLFALAFLAFPIAAGMAVMIEPLIEVVPRYAKWEPALVSFYLFTASSVLAILSSPFVNTLNALGKVRYTFFLMLMWTALTWILVPLSLNWFGFNGVALAAFIIGLTSFVPLWVVRRFIPFSFIGPMSKPVAATVILLGILFIVKELTFLSSRQLLIGIPVAIVTYSLLAYLLMKKELRPYIDLLLRKHQ